MTKWANMILKRGPALEASSAATKFKVPRFVVYRVICDILERDGRLTEAAECFRQMQSKLPGHAGVRDERAEWELGRWLQPQACIILGTLTLSIRLQTLSLDPLSAVLLTKRSKARAGMGSWEYSLQDANAAIKLKPSSLCGHQRKHAALVGARRYTEAIDAYNDMLLMLEQSADPVTQELRKSYVTPSQTKTAIHNAVKRTQRDAPLVVINTKTGRLCDQRERMHAFESDPKFLELAASMTTRLDHSRIQEVVQEYFRYATFSHTWEGAEPLFNDVLHGSVHKLAESCTVLKLVMFCATVRDVGFHWAWCDTCCIDKADSSVLQESLTSMFQWYHKSSLTIIHLKGVLSDSEVGALEWSLWNTRAWTLQEFFASRVIRFYTEDWKPYRPGEKVYNHKESIRQCTTETVSCCDTGCYETRGYGLLALWYIRRLSLGHIWRRATTRLLQEVLTRSGDVSILAWTGKASDYNSCLPAEISVYREPASPYVPSPIEDDKMDGLVTELRTSSQTVDSAMMLYDRVIVLPSPRLVSRRLSLSCIMFPLRGPLVVSGNSPQRVYHTTMSALGIIEIKTTEDLSSLNNLVLVHPWLRCLLDPALPFEDDIEVSPVDSDPLSHTASSSHHAPRLDKLTRALRLFARLRQPFGALLLVPLSHDEYKRVASDRPIFVQLLKDISPCSLAQKILTLDIL
ncbi:hypothetical protein HD554DRAFT_2238808 [Boletus coccyginus]|nr:hypothetical protein HD554DRAFT_2238808 [Boletus coccyginus]